MKSIKFKLLSEEVVSASVMKNMLNNEAAVLEAPKDLYHADKVVQQVESVNHVASVDTNLVALEVPDNYVVDQEIIEVTVLNTPVSNTPVDTVPVDSNIYGTNGDDVIHAEWHNPTDDIILTFAGDDKVFGNGGDDYIDGGSGDDELHGWEGNDFIRGGIGDDHIDGDVGDDALYGQNGDDVIVGGQGNDVLYGGQGNDELYGGDGDDLLNGGVGNDALFGGSGADTYVFDTLNGMDTISGMNGAEGDVIDISSLLNAYDPLQDDINDFLTLTMNSDWKVELSVDVDGANGPAESVALVSFSQQSDDISTMLDTMLQDGSLLI